MTSRWFSKWALTAREEVTLHWTTSPSLQSFAAQTQVSSGHPLSSRLDHQNSRFTQPCWGTCRGAEMISDPPGHYFHRANLWPLHRQLWFWIWSLPLHPGPGHRIVLEESVGEAQHIQERRPHNRSRWEKNPETNHKQNSEKTANEPTYPQTTKSQQTPSPLCWPIETMKSRTGP